MKMWVGDSVVLSLNSDGETIDTFAFDSEADIIAGRGEDCPIRVFPNIARYNTVSNRHCIFRIVPPRIYVSDYGSSNSTLVNGENLWKGFKRRSVKKKVAKDEFRFIELHEGDKVALCNGIEITVSIMPAVPNDEGEMCPICEDRPIKTGSRFCQACSGIMEQRNTWW